MAQRRGNTRGKKKKEEMVERREGEAEEVETGGDLMMDDGWEDGRMGTVDGCPEHFGAES